MKHSRKNRRNIVKISVWVFLAVVMIALLLLAALPARAQTPVVSVDAPDCVESDFAVRVTVTTFSNCSAAPFDVSYDNTVLQLTSATDGDIGGNTLDVSWSWQTPGNTVIIDFISNVL